MVMGRRRITRQKPRAPVINIRLDLPEVDIRPLDVIGNEILIPALRFRQVRIRPTPDDRPVIRQARIHRSHWPRDHERRRWPSIDVTHETLRETRTSSRVAAQRTIIVPKPLSTHTRAPQCDGHVPKPITITIHQDLARLTYSQSADIIRTELREMSEKRYQIWAGGKLAPHQDIATVFYTRCAELYAEVGATHRLGSLALFTICRTPTVPI